MAVIFKSLNTGDINPGASKNVEWTADKDYTIKAVVLNERNDYSLSPVKAYVSIEDRVKTKDYVPARIIGQDLEYCWKPDEKITAGTRIYFKFENAGANTLNIDVTLVLEE